MKIYQDILRYTRSGNGRYHILMRTCQSPYTQVEICRAYDKLFLNDFLFFDGKKIALTDKGQQMLTQFSSSPSLRELR